MDNFLCQNVDRQIYKKGTPLKYDKTEWKIQVIEYVFTYVSGNYVS